MSHYVSDHQKAWDKYVRPQSYVYTTRAFRSAETALFSFCLVKTNIILFDRGAQDKPILWCILWRIILHITTPFISTCGGSEEPRCWINIHSIESIQDWLWKIFRTLSTFRVGQFVYLMKPSRAVLASVVNKVGTKTYNKWLIRASDSYKNTIVRDSTLSLLEDGVESTISIDRVTQAPCLNKSHHVKTNNDSSLENGALAQNTKTQWNDNI